MIFSSPGNTVHSVLIGGWNQEADRWYRRLAAFIVQHPPLVRLRVVQQSTFISSVDCDLEEDIKTCSCSTYTEPDTAYSCNSCVLNKMVIVYVISLFRPLHNQNQNRKSVFKNFVVTLICIHILHTDMSHAYLHLFEVTNSLDGLFALYWAGRVTWFQLDDGLGSPLQAFQVSFKLVQLLFLIL